jgi:hypothetical protein
MLKKFLTFIKTNKSKIQIISIATLTIGGTYYLIKKIEEEERIQAKHEKALLAERRNICFYSTAITENLTPIVEHMVSQDKATTEMLLKAKKGAQYLTGKEKKNIWDFCTLEFEPTREEHSILIMALIDNYGIDHEQYSKWKKSASKYLSNELLSASLELTKFENFSLALPKVVFPVENQIDNFYEIKKVYSDLTKNFFECMGKYFNTAPLDFEPHTKESIVFNFCFLTSKAKLRFLDNFIKKKIRDYNSRIVNKYEWPLQYRPFELFKKIESRHLKNSYASNSKKVEMVCAFCLNFMVKQMFLKKIKNIFSNVKGKIDFKKKIENLKSEANLLLLVYEHNLEKNVKIFNFFVEKVLASGGEMFTGKVLEEALEKMVELNNLTVGLVGHFSYIIVRVSRINNAKIQSLKNGIVGILKQKGKWV